MVGLLPLLGLLWAVMLYSEHLYLRSVDGEMAAEVERVAEVLERQIYRRAALLDSLAESTILQQFAKTLFMVREKGELVEGYAVNLLSLQYLLLDMQPLIAEDAVIRVLDPDARTILKFGFGRTSHPSLETLQPYGILEQEPPASFVRYLRSLPGDQISHLPFPDSPADFGGLKRLPLLDGVRPVEADGHRIYLVFSSRGESINNLLVQMPRLRDASLSIGGRAPPEVFYSDVGHWQFGILPRTGGRIPPLLALLENKQLTEEQGILVGGESRFYYTDFFPYRDELTSWVVAADVDEGVLLNFFQPLRWGVALIAAIAFLLGVLLVTGLSRKIAAPVARLAKNLKNYAQGVPMLPDIPSKALEIRELQNAFTFMTQRLEDAQLEKNESERQLAQAERLASIGEMAAGIGHELNNPLNNILSLARLMKSDGPSADTFEEDMDGLMDEAQRASNIVGGVLRFARQVPPEYRVFDVCQWLATCLQRVKIEAEAAGIAFETQCSENLALYADAMQLEQVMVNLLVNSVQASPKGETVRISAYASSGECVLTVSDHGSGISSDVSGHIFEPFFTTKGVGEGSGLGLSISMGIVTSHNGSLTLTNREGADSSGVMAVLRLPLGKHE